MSSAWLPAPAHGTFSSCAEAQDMAGRIAALVMSSHESLLQGLATGGTVHEGVCVLSLAACTCSAAVRRSACWPTQ